MAQPIVYQPQAEPEYTSAVSTESSRTSYSSYKFFKVGFDEKIDFRKPTFDIRHPTVTVFRPFPCRSFSDPNNGFEPYRKDPAGKNFFGHWLCRIQVAWNVGSPSTSFIVHDPFSTRQFDARLTPLSILFRAIKHAVKRGQGKGKEWGQQALRRPFDVDAQTLLEWDGMTEGGEQERALITPVKELFLMQGAILQLGGEPTEPGKAPIGWGDNPTCVFALTGGVGEQMVNLLNTETENYRGDPGNFEARYVDGDPVSLTTGRYLYVYPKVGDPRKQQYISQPTDDAFAYTGAAAGSNSGKKKSKEDIGFGCHFQRDYQGRAASLAPMADGWNHSPNAAMIRHKWLHWREILYCPSLAEQAAILGGIMPAAALCYAFEGEHNEWLTPEIRAKAKELRSASVPAAPPTGYAQQNPGGFGGYPGAYPGGYQTSPAGYNPQPQAGYNPQQPAADNPFGVPPVPAGFQAPPAPLNTDPHPGDPFGAKMAADPALSAPPVDAGFSPLPSGQQKQLPTSSLDGMFGAMMDAANQRDAANAPSNPTADSAPPPPPPPPPGGPGGTFGFDQPPSGTSTAAMLAAAKAKMLN